MQYSEHAVVEAEGWGLGWGICVKAGNGGQAAIDKQRPPNAGRDGKVHAYNYFSSRDVMAAWLDSLVLGHRHRRSCKDVDLTHRTRAPAESTWTAGWSFVWATTQLGRL